jgi:hypothetical protein
MWRCSPILRMTAIIEDMEIEIKYLITVASIVVALVIAFIVTPRHLDSGAGWTNGKRNLLRRALYDSDDRLRRHAKPAIILFFALLNGALWIFL